jgi:hypothetical protein
VETTQTIVTSDIKGGERIDGWKAIGAYLGRDRSTVIRWANERGLPIRSVPGGKIRTVFAFRSDLDRWLQYQDAVSLAADQPGPRCTIAAEPCEPGPAGLHGARSRDSRPAVDAETGWIGRAACPPGARGHERPTSGSGRTGLHGDAVQGAIRPPRRPPTRTTMWLARLSARRAPFVRSTTARRSKVRGIGRGWPTIRLLPGQLVTTRPPHGSCAARGSARRGARRWHAPSSPGCCC